MVNKQVAIIMGSKSDMPVMEHTMELFKEFGVSYDVKVLSAHRTPKQTIKFASTAAARGYEVIIAAAGGAAHLAGVIAAHTILPVIGVPIETKALEGIDSLFSTVQMPAGIPVGCMAIGKAGSINACVFATEILAIKNKGLQKKLNAYKESLAAKVLKK